MPFHNTLSRLKGKLRKGPRNPSKDENPTPSSVYLPAVIPDPARDNMDTPGSVQKGAELLLLALNASADPFPPLKSAVGGLHEYIQGYERAENWVYINQFDKINQLLEELRGYLQDREAMEITDSVKRMCCELDSEVKNLKIKFEKSRGVESWLKAMYASDEITEYHNRIQQLLERLTFNASVNILKKLNIQGENIDKYYMDRQLASLPARSSIYNSAEADSLGRRSCTEGTRERVITSLLEWARAPNAGRIYWINGMAGTGKTAIAYSICEKLDRTASFNERSGVDDYFGIGGFTKPDNAFMLGASFFCSSAIPECRQARNIIPTIAYQLCRYSTPFHFAIDQILRSDPDVATRTLGIQYKSLIVDPLAAVQDALPTNFIVVIDALDECENTDSLGEILDLISSTPIFLPIRFLVSSRPEPEINQRMEGRVNEQGNTRLVLHDLGTESIKMDIATYVRRELQYIPLTDVQFSGLLERCGVLFIYASTLCRFIKQEHDSMCLNEAVDAILVSASEGMEPGSERTIDALYTTVLDKALRGGFLNQDKRKRMRDILETVLCVGEPIDSFALAQILGLESSEHVHALIRPLRSVLNVTNTGLVTTLHASFPDFMYSKDRSGMFHCDQKARNVAVAKACLNLIAVIKPTFNICGLTSSHPTDGQVNDLQERVNRSISPGLIYASRYWSTHLYLGEYGDSLVPLVRNFFEERLLIWMEVLNLTKRIRYGESIIQHAERWCREWRENEDLVALAGDAGQFVSVYANHPVSESTPHIYLSMLPFWPRSRPISAIYMPRTFGITEVTGSTIVRRQPAFLATWRASSVPVLSISLSADGTRIVADTDDAIHLLDVSTGGDEVLRVEEIQTKEACAVDISPGGAQVAFASHSGAYLLDVKDRQITKLYHEQIIRIPCILFSPDGSQVAVASFDNNIYICAPQEGVILHKLAGHNGAVNSVAFSPDGKYLASGSDDRTIQTWGTRSGQLVGNFTGHTSYVLSVSYSPDGSRLASSSADCTIRVWDPQTGQTVLGPLKGHSGWVRSITFSPDGSFIASGSTDKTIRVYDTTTGQTILGPLEGHMGPVRSIIVAPDGIRLFSCSDDGTIRLWNIQDRYVPNTSHPTVPPNFLCVRYSPDGLRVVSGSGDGTLCIWDVQTGNRVLGPLQGHTNAVFAVDYSPDGAYIASASSDRTLRIWSAQDGKGIHGPIQGHTRQVNCVQFSADSSLLVSGSDDRTVRVWDVQTGQQVIEPLRGHSDSVLSVAFSPNRSHVVSVGRREGEDKDDDLKREKRSAQFSGSFDCNIRVWEIQTGQTVIGPLQGHEIGVSSVVFSSDGSQILSGSWEGSIAVWDAITGQPCLIFGLGYDGINSVTFSPDGGLVVSASDDCTICVWDARGGHLMLILEGDTGPVLSVQFSPDGSHVVSCSKDGTIRFWDVSSCQTRLHDMSRKDHAEMNDYSRVEIASKSWSVRDDGWVVDRADQRLVWVPPDLQLQLLPPANVSIIPNEHGLGLNFGRANIGEQWTDCYRP
ncbi:unnamed protein product [Rhizoctonia solani]|uniref:Nephrocystin 3-like N-terminal domain-containing protein n=1 Tax=Rhizoctonia solani TaxID=456999 RepID=A0A8H3BAH0_9AGAM|nr:unnamed protein product [Rhizoctonia solani]